MYKLTFLIFLILSSHSYGQKKVTPVTKSTITGIELPNGSKEDKRFISISAANLLMQDIAKKNKTSVHQLEVLYLPSNYSLELLQAAIQTAGWTMIVEKNETKYYWLSKDGKSVLVYFDNSQKDLNLYFATTNQITAPENSQTPKPPVKQEQNTTINEPQNNNTQPTQEPLVPTNTVTIPNTGFQFNSTNFDDGWVSTVREDWVEVAKNNVHVLLHYPKDGTIFPADPEPLINTVWNILVAPRYKSLSNYKTAYINNYDRPYLGFGNVIELSTGKALFVLLFRQGNSGWLEFITSDKNAFIEYFKFDPYAIRWDSESDLLKPLLLMGNYNKFAIGANDLSGKWTSDFTGIQQLYNVYTGQYAGMNINQSNEEFVFTPGNKYSWKLLVVNGMVGATNYNQVQSTGTYSFPNNWQLHFSKIEKGPKTYHAFFSCIKGARILNLLDAQYPGSGIYTRYGIAK